MKRPVALKTVRRAEDLIPFSGACQDCRFCQGDTPVYWRCGAHGGRLTRDVRSERNRCESWQLRSEPAIIAHHALFPRWALGAFLILLGAACGAIAALTL